jgi:ankyrin repeat protein
MNVPDSNGLTPIFYGSIHVNIFEFLSKQHHCSLTVVSNKGLTLLHYCATLDNALPAMKKLLDSGTPVDTLNPITLETPLFVATSLGRLGNAKELIARGANVNARRKDTCFPLYLTAQKGHLAIVQELLEAGADKKATFQSYTAYQIALKFKHEEIANLLQPKESVARVASHSNTNSGRGGKHNDNCALQ